MLFITYDPHTNNFIKTATLTGGTNAYAVDYMVKAFKGNSLWDKYVLIYPFIGGTSDSNKINLKSSAYTSTFSGGITHNNNGVTLNGTNGHILTGLSNTGLTQNNFHISIYSRTSGSTGFDVSGGVSPRTELILSYNSGAGDTYFDMNNNTANSSRFSWTGETNATGLYLASRSASTSYNLFRRGTLLRNDTDVSAAPGNVDFIIGRFAGGGFFSNRNYSFASFGSNMDENEALIMNTIIETTQEILNRKV